MLRNRTFSLVKILLNFFLIVFLLIMLSSCTLFPSNDNNAGNNYNNNGITPLNVSFKDQTLFGSPNYVISVNYAEDKQLLKNYTDIMVKSSVGDISLDFTKEMGETFKIYIKNPYEWVSLTEYLDNNDDYATFETAQSTTFIIKTDKKTELSFKAVAGELKNGELDNIFDVSKEFKVKIENL